MQALKLLRDSLIQFNTTIRAAYMKSNLKMRYMFILAIILCLPYFVNSIQIARTISNNGQTITQQIPNFTIQDGNLESENQEPFIYETDFFIYAFDPQDEIQFKEIEDINPLSLIVESNPDTHAFGIVGNRFNIDNSELSNSFNQDSLKELILSASQMTWWVYPIVFVILAIIELAYVALGALFIAVFSKYMVTSRNLPLGFKERFNLALPAMTQPIVIITILRLFNILVPFQFEIILFVALLRIYFMLKQTKVIMVKREDLDKDNDDKQ